MSHRKDIDDTLLVQMYNDSTIRLTEIEAHFDANVRTIRAHLRKFGVEPNRKVSVPWTVCEEGNLCDAKKLGLTGAELQAAVPTRTLNSIKGHVTAMVSRGVDMSIDIDSIEEGRNVL